MALKGVAEFLIENEIGCGPFQVAVTIFLFVFMKMSLFFTTMFMSFGNYNPGWRCLDNNTDVKVTGVNVSSPTPKTTDVDYEKDLSCDAFEACQQVEFNPESFTIVTEWNLVCDRAWISSLIISLQMAGSMLGCFAAGHLADTIGRKKTLYGPLLITTILTGLSVFSPSWQIFAVLRFFIGISSSFIASLHYLYPAEFLTAKWRGPLSGIPAWSIGGIAFGVTSMLLKNWKHLLIFTTIVSVLSLIPAVWVPESLRWLEVRNKQAEFQRVAVKMARCNKRTLHNMDSLDFTVQQAPDSKRKKAKTYTPLDLFRHGYRLISICIGFLWLSFSIIFFSIGFGIKALSGDFYINFILIYSIMLPFFVLSFFTPNLFGRKKSSFIFMTTATVCLLAAMAFDLSPVYDLRTVATLVLVILARICTETTLTIQQVHVTEIYPTVIRGVGFNGALLMGRTGGIIAPFLIPKDSDSVYIWYLVMGCLGFLCCCLVTRLPETRGKPLKDTFDDTTETSNKDKKKHDENGKPLKGMGAKHEKQNYLNRI